MKPLYDYIVNEGVKDTINKLKSLFKKKEKYVYKTEVGITIMATPPTVP